MTVPSRLLFREEDITAYFLFGPKVYTYQTISDIQFHEEENGSQFLHMKIGKQKLNLEVDHFHVRQIQKYIPVS